MHPFARLLLLWSLLFPTALSAADPSVRLQDALAEAHWMERIPIIVTFSSNPDLQVDVRPEKLGREGVVQRLHSTAEADQRDVRSFLRGRGESFDDLWIVNGLAVEATPQIVDALSRMPEIASIEFDFSVQIPEEFPSTASSVLWNISTVGAPELWALGAQGQGVTVAIIDTGVSLAHPDIASSWRGGSNSWYDPYGKAADPYDAHGHGTAVTGIIVGGSAGGAPLGVAPRAQWIAAKAFADDGTARISRIILTLQWLLDPNRDGTGRDAPDLVNLSWGFDAINRCFGGASDASEATGTVHQAVKALRSAGIGIVAAAGNKSGGKTDPSSISPGNYPEILSVGAIDRTLAIASFSSRGPSACDGTLYPDLVAPGVSVRSLPDRHWSGTSFAAPHVVGVMALLLSVQPDLSIDTLEKVLRASGSDIGENGPDNGAGFGIVNSAAALKLLKSPPTPAQLIAPEYGSTQNGSVTFRWNTPPDPLGLSVTDVLLVSGSEDFSTPLTPPEEEVDTLLAGAGNLLIGWALTILVRRNRKGSAMLLASLSLVTMVACGGGGGTHLISEVDPDSVERIEGLAPGTYFWKIVSENPLGARSESEVWNFEIE